MSAQTPTDTHVTWRRVHWVTPLVWSVKYLLIFVVVIGANIIDDLRGLIAELRSPSDQDASAAWQLAPYVAGVVLAIIAVIGLVSWLSWRKIQYAVGDEAVYYHHGIIFRKQRYARLDRIQAIDMVRPLLARFFGLVALDVQTAGGSGSNVQVAYVKEDVGEALRNEILARAAGVQAKRGTSVLQDAPPADALTQGESANQSARYARAPEIEVLSVPTGRLIGSIFASAVTVVFLIALLGATIVVTVLQMPSLALIGALLPTALILLAFPWMRFSGEFGFTLALSPDGIRTRHGLLETRAQTVPPRRIQAVEISQPLLWRPFGWWKVQVNIAGYGKGSDKENTATSIAKNTLLPVGTLLDAQRVLWLVIADTGMDNQQQQVADFIAGSGTIDGFEHVESKVKWIDWFTWRRRALRVTRTCLLIRDGFFIRTATVVPHERTQSLAASQGPVERLLHIANLHAHSVPGPATPAAYHLPEARVQQLLWQQTERARKARQAEGPEQWMRRVGVETPANDEPTTAVQGDQQPDGH